MNTLLTCSCGAAADGEGTRCARCAALEVLELKAGASENEIKEAYRVLVKVWHPDRFQSDTKLRAAAEDKLKALNTAYCFLTTRAAKREHRRAAHAQSGATDKTDAPRADGGGGKVRYDSKPRVAVRRRRFVLSTTMVLSLGAMACGVLILVLVLGALDSTLASDTTVGRFYAPVRYRVVSRFRQSVVSIWSGAGQRLRDLAPHGSAPAAAVNPQPDGLSGTMSASMADSAAGASAAQSAHRRELGAAQAAPVKLMPYITVGLTKDEVMAIAGTPTVATDNKLVYQGSEIDFTGGKVSGWKIDAASAPIRVKLWPDAPVDPDLDSFGVGSSKNVVLVVQGTPTYFSEDEFGYGGSVVYFQNGRVVSWKDDAAGVPLRTAQRRY